MGLLLFIFPAFVSAQTAQDLANEGLDSAATTATLQAGDLPTTIGAIVGVLLSVLGVVFLVIVIYGGITWMTAGGDEKKVEKGRKMLIEGAIGMLICVSAYSLSVYVVQKITSSIQ